MKLETKHYSKDFRNLIIGNLESEISEIKNAEGISEQENKVEEIQKYIFILKNGIISEYDKIIINIEDNIGESEEITEETSSEVLEILRLYSQIDFAISSQNDSNLNRLKFEGFNEHDDEDLDKGQVRYAEFVINFENKFPYFKDRFNQGAGLVMSNYKEVLKYFTGKEVTIESIKEFDKIPR